MRVMGEVERETAKSLKLVRDRIRQSYHLRQNLGWTEAERLATEEAFMEADRIYQHFIDQWLDG